MSPMFDSEHGLAAMQGHALEWCPRAAASVMQERLIKQKGVVGLSREGARLYTKGNTEFRALITGLNN
ncbi:unnamed protein product [Onchocerca ochengi]|uniref:Transcriptional regulator n=1 Tax=Onchocerca ochengi TaxID=42157 RepID=A0A182EQH4_ONCOC|nr:unnamed protein product [Onchocerca ochengi]